MSIKRWHPFDDRDATDAERLALFRLMFQWAGHAVVGVEYRPVQPLIPGGGEVVRPRPRIVASEEVVPRRAA